MNHNEIDGNNYNEKKGEWLNSLKNYLLCTAFSYAWYTKDMV